jgi:hypothetical protein
MEGPNTQPEGPLADGQAHAEGTTAGTPTVTGTALPELTSLTEMVRALIEDRERRERDAAQERERRDREFALERERMDRIREEDCRRYAEESERRIREVCSQMEQLQGLVTGSAALSAPRGSGAEAIKLTRLGEKDDIEAYLTTFERIMEVNEVAKERWPFQLAPQLTGKAQQAYAALTPENAKDYDAVKNTILRRFNINEETYRQRFRSLKPKEEESPQELMTRLQDLAARWTKDAATHRELLNLLVREQFLRVLPTEVEIAVMERKPKDCTEASQFAANYLQARASSIASKKPKVPATNCPRCGGHGHWARECPQARDAEGGQRPSSNQGSSPSTRGPKDPRSSISDIQKVKCFACNEKGHYASGCPKRSLYCGGTGTSPRKEDKARRGGTVNGILLSRHSRGHRGNSDIGAQEISDR